MTIAISDATITITELAARLSSVIDDVEQGATVTITRHGKPVATLSVAGESPAEAGKPLVAKEEPTAYAVAAAPESASQPPTALMRLIGTGSSQVVLSVFVREPMSALYQREIARRTGLGLRSAQIALDRLEQLGLVASERDGNRRYYRAVRTDRFEDLRALLSRELGITEVIARHLSKTGLLVTWAFVFGSAASGEDTIDSDIDLLVVSEASDDALVEPIAAAQRELGREIDLVSYRPDEFAKKRSEGNHFIASALARARLDVIGGPNDA